MTLARPLAILLALVCAMAALIAGPVSAQAPSPEQGRAITELPLDSGLPVIVRAGLAFNAIDTIDENAETFTGTVDLRLQWTDRRLAYPAVEAPLGYREWRGGAADAQLAAIWSPDVGLVNLDGEPTAVSQSVRIFTDGRVELLRRVTGVFKTVFDVRKFPFDHQDLVVEIASRRETAEKVSFDFRQDDLVFSRADAGIDVPGWNIGLIELVRAPLSGWYGESYSRLKVSLAVERRAAETIPGLFIPLLASLLIPLLATWLNAVRNGEFQTEAFELTNIVIGGLFAVIALNFTVNTDRSILATGTNTVSLLFGLNYLTLAVSLAINIALFRFNAVRAVAGRHVQHETFAFITWALPLLVAAAAAALILIAAV